MCEVQTQRDEQASPVPGGRAPLVQSAVTNYFTASTDLDDTCPCPAPAVTVSYPEEEGFMKTTQVNYY